MLALLLVACLGATTVVAAGDTTHHQLTPPPDVLPYTTAMTGLSTRAFTSAAGATDGSIAVAVSLLFYPGTTVATMGLFAQVASRRSDRISSDNNSVRDLLRVCYNEPFDMAVNDADGSQLAFHAAGNPFSCPATFLRELVAKAGTDTPFGFVNLTATVRPFHPEQLLRLQLFADWGLDLQPAQAFDEVLNGATTGPVTLMGDAAVAFCTEPGALQRQSPGGDAGRMAAAWSARALFTGAYNLAVHMTALASSSASSSSSTSSPTICGGAAGSSGLGSVSTGPLVYRMSGGRLDVVASLASSSSSVAAADGTVAAAVPADRDVVNATMACVNGRRPAGYDDDEEEGGGAFLFVAGTSVWLVSDGEASQMTPDACWRTPAFGRAADWTELVGRSFAGHYGALAAVTFTIVDVAQQQESAAAAAATGANVTLFITGTVRTETFTADCSAARPTPVIVDRASGVGTLANATACLGQALGHVGQSAWMRLEYVSGADAFWVALYGGAFMATRAAA